MRHCVPEDGRFLTPIRMLIESMPGTYFHISVEASLSSGTTCAIYILQLLNYVA